MKKGIPSKIHWNVGIELVLYLLQDVNHFCRFLANGESDYVVSDGDRMSLDGCATPHIKLINSSDYAIIIRNFFDGVNLDDHNSKNNSHFPCRTEHKMPKFACFPTLFFLLDYQALLPMTEYSLQFFSDILNSLVVFSCG